MLHTAVPAEIPHVPANPADTYHCVFDLVYLHSAAFQHPQAASGQKRKKQRAPFPLPAVDQRKEKKADNKIDNQQNLTGHQSPLVIRGYLSARFRHLLMQEIQKKLHIYPPYFSSFLTIMHHFFILCNCIMQICMQMQFSFLFVLQLPSSCG